MLGEPVRDRRAERHLATRAEIIEAAWEQVRASGLAALSLRDLARSVGMQPPSLYSYFDSKNDIYDAMYAQGAQQFLDEQRAATVATDDPLTALKAITHFFVEFCAADVARYQLLFQRTIPGFEPSPYQPGREPRDPAVESQNPDDFVDLSEPQSDGNREEANATSAASRP